MTLLMGNIVNENVTRIHPYKTVQFAGQLLKAVDISCLVVTDDDGSVIGIVTERDLVQKVIADGLDVQNTLVRDVMTKDVITLEKKDTVKSAVDLMEKRGIKKIPITDRGRLMGIVTLTDVVKALRKVADGKMK